TVIIGGMPGWQIALIAARAAVVAAAVAAILAHGYVKPLQTRGGSGGRRLDGLVRASGGRTAGRSCRASSASLTAVSSWVSRSAAQSSGDMMTSTSGSM